MVKSLVSLLCPPYDSSRHQFRIKLGKTWRGIRFSVRVKKKQFHEITETGTGLDLCHCPVIVFVFPLPLFNKE